MKLSVAIATHNEEKNILRTLESVYEWVDEIVIVDGESTDNTVELIKKQDTSNKIQIFKEKNPLMFHINKQKAIERCKSEWILQLDADEVVSKELKDEIKSVIARSETTKQSPLAYWLPRLNYFMNRPLKKGGQYPDYTIRLYKNGVARFPCITVHEQVEIITPSSSPGVERIGFLNYPLLHFPYPTFSEYVRKWKLYCQLEAQNLKKAGVKPSLYLASCYLFLYPTKWFLSTYFRHLGILDGLPGLIFSFFSSIRYWLIYSELLKKQDTITT